MVQQIITQDKWASALKADSLLEEVMILLETRWVSKKEGTTGSEAFWNVRNELSVSKGMLLRGTRLVPPCSIREELVNLAHEAHQGISKTNERLRADYWWPGKIGRAS